MSEFRVEWAPDSDPAQKTAVVLQNAQADFSQQGYEVATAIDGQKADTNNGWATAPKTGENRTAVFETRDNVGGSPGVLTCFLDQEFADGMHTIGRFRISITTAERPVRLDGLPKNITDILAVKVDQRNDQQKAELLAYYRGTDGELKKREQAAVEARKPRAIDPQLQTLRDALAEVSKPLPVDPKLAQLRHDVEAEHPTTAERAAYVCTGPGVGADQQPCVLVQSIEETDGRRDRQNKVVVKQSRSVLISDTVLSARIERNITMLVIPGQPGKDLCDRGVGITRRELLRVGGAGMLGMSLGADVPPAGPGGRKHVVGRTRLG